MSENSKKRWRGLVGAVVMLAALTSWMGCATYVQESRRYRHGLSQNASNAHYVDGDVVHTSIGEGTAVELRLNKRDNTFGETVLEADIYVENLSDARFDFGPDDVIYVRVQESYLDRDVLERDEYTGRLAEFVFAEYWKGVPPDMYAVEIAEITPDGVGSAIGGLGTALSGGTIGEAIIAQNQANAAAAARINANRSQVTTTRQELIDVYTLRPAEAVSGRIGFGHVTRLEYTNTYDSRDDAMQSPDGFIVTADSQVEYGSSFPRRGRDLESSSPDDGNWQRLSEINSQIQSGNLEKTLAPALAVGSEFAYLTLWDTFYFYHPQDEVFDDRVNAYIFVRTGEEIHRFRILSWRK